MPNIFVSYQFNLDDGRNGFGHLTYNAAYEPASPAEVDQLHRDLTDMIVKDSGLPARIVILWWKTLGK